MDPACLVVFIDETGNEHFKDDRHPVFGFGGCAVLAADLDAAVREPWRQVRRAVNGSPDEPLHAGGRPRWLPHEFAVVADFFRRSPCLRIASMSSRVTLLPSGMPAIDAVAGSFKKRIIDVARWTSFQSIALIFEKTDRLKGEIERAFGNFEIEEDGR